MKILSIETSCDETAIAILEAEGGIQAPSFSVLANNLISQIDIHKEFGGVYPNLAKREHAKNLPLLLEKTLSEAGMSANGTISFSEEAIRTILSRENEMADRLIQFLKIHDRPEIDYIAVTIGPGLEPALWVGITFAKALAKAWNIPLMPVNHMEGHILSVLLSHEENKTINTTHVQFPALALLISGGHTELVFIKNWMDYDILGETQDDAVGEAFDKVARILGLPYPGGPEISKLAEEGKENDKVTLPRPMIKTNDYHFSFSGLKTAVLYAVKKIETITDQDKKDIAREFQTAVGDVFVTKLKRAIEEYNIQTLIVAGGVAANTYLRDRFQKELSLPMLLPDYELSTDNAIMIAIAGYFRALEGKEKSPDEVRAQGTWSVSSA